MKHLAQHNVHVTDTLQW